MIIIIDDIGRFKMIVNEYDNYVRKTKMYVATVWVG
jgi:hypothetical protein